MFSFLKFVFHQSYVICIRVFKETEFPWAFGAAVVTFYVVTTLVTPFMVLEYIMLPEKIEIYGNYYGAFAVAVWILLQIYVTRRDRCKIIVAEVDAMPRQRLIRFRVIAIAYAIFLISCFFTSSILYVESTR